MANIKGITIEIEGKTSGLVKSLNNVNKSLKSTQDSLKTVNKALKLDPKNVETLAQKQSLLTKAIDETKQKLEIEKQVAEDAAKALEEGTITSEQYDALQAEVQLTTAELKKLEQEADATNQTLSELGSGSSLQNLSTSIQNAGKQIEELGSKVKSVGDGMQQLGGNLTKSVTAPIVGMGKASLDAFNEVDGAMDTIAKKTGAVGESAEQYRKILENIATSIPTDFDTASQAIGEVATRFDVTGDELEELSTEFIKFAELNDTDVSSSIDSVQSAMAQFGLSAEDAVDVMDILTKESQNTGVSVDELSNQLVTNGVALQEMGFGINSSIGFLGSLSKAGVDSSAVLGGLKKALVNATKDGKSMDEALADLEADLMGAKDGTEQMQIAMDLFGSKSAPQLVSALQEGRISFDELENSVRDFGGSVDNTFEGTLDPIDGMTTASNELKLALSEVGSTVGETLAPILEDLAEGIKKVAEWWKGLNPETQQFIIKAAMIAAVVGPVLVILGSLISAIGTIIGVIGSAVTAIGGLIGGAGLAGLGATITGTVLPAIGAALTAAAPVIGVIAGIAAAIGIVIAIIKNWGAIVEWLQGVWEGFKNFISGLWEGIKSLASSIWNGITSTIQGAVQGAKDWLVGAWNGIKDTAVNVWNGMKSTASNIWNGLKSGVSGIIDGLKTSLSDKWDSIKTTASQAWDNMKSSISEKAGALKSAAVSAMEGMKSGIQSALSSARQWGSDMMSNIAGGISGAIGKVKGAVSSVAGVIRSFLHFTEPDVGPLSDFHTYMPDMIKEMTSGMLNGVPKVEASATQLGSAIRDGVTTDYSGQLGTINQSIKGMQLSAGDTTVYVQISDSQLQRAVAKVIRGDALRSGGR